MMLPGSPEEIAAFEKIQERLAPLFQAVANDPRKPHSVVVVPSLSLDKAELEKISGVHHYEERLLYMLMLLRRPTMRLVYVTSQPLNPSIVDYYLQLLSGVPGNHARNRLHLLSCLDASAIPLSQKVLDRPRLQERILDAIPDHESAHLSVFNSTSLERSLAVSLGIPLYATDPALWDLGTKSGCREVFREAGVTFPDGFERLRSEDDIVGALAKLKIMHPELRKAVVKLNDGFSGEGNAVFRFTGCPEEESERPEWIRAQLPSLGFEAKTETWPTFKEKYAFMGGVVEQWIDGEGKRSPSCQCRVNALGQAQIISTHDQVLGGPNGQVFLGCTFPADAEYRLDVQNDSFKVAQVLADKGVVGRFATDFVSVRSDNGWTHYAIEVNLRKGGTTHPFLTLKFLTDGIFDPQTGQFLTPTGRPKFYYASDTLYKPAYRGLSPDDLIDIAVYHGIHFHGASERGVVFHLMGALSEFGKLGLVCIGDNPQQARFLYNKTVQVLDTETKRLHGERQARLLETDDA